MADPLGLDLREAVDGLTGYAYADLNALWRDLPEDPVLAREALNDVLPALVTVYGEAASTLAADWYDDLRDSVGPRMRFAAIPAGFADTGAYELVGWATTRAVDATSLRALVEGGVQRRVANFSRQTVMASAVKDPAATGWQRVGAGACRSGFCAMLIGRGAVYTEATADFASHDNCKCGAVPAWGGEPVPVRPYTPSARRSDADRERTPGTRKREVAEKVDIDASRSVAQLRTTLADLERSAAKFSTPGTTARIEDLRRKIAAR